MVKLIQAVINIQLVKTVSDTVIIHVNDKEKFDFFPFVSILAAFMGGGIIVWALETFKDYLKSLRIRRAALTEIKTNLEQIDHIVVKKYPWLSCSVLSRCLHSSCTLGLAKQVGRAASFNSVALMRAVEIVECYELVQIDLQLFCRSVDFLS